MLKLLLWTIGGLLIFVILALLTLPLWINPVGTTVANAVVPKLTDTAFNLERINLNPYTGKLLVSGVKLANPEGYAEKDAFSLGSLSVDIEVSSLLSSTIHVRDVTVDAPFASYVFDAAGSNNIYRIIATVNEKLGPKEKKEKEPSETKVVIDKVTVKNVRAVVNTGVFELESLTVADFGKADAPAKIELSDVKLMNPEGFPEPNAFSLKALSIGMETADLSKKPMVFHDIIVDSPYAGVFINGDWDLNFKVLFKPLLGDEKKEEKEKTVAADEKKDDEKKDEDGPRVVIDKLDISGTRIQFDSPIPVLKGTIPIPLPPFTNIGKDSAAGATVKDVGEKVLAEAKGIVGPVGGVLEKIIRNPAGNMKEILDVDAVKMLGDAKDLLTAGATNVLGNAKDFVSGSATNVVGSATALIGGATNVVGGATGFLKGVLPGGDDKKDDKKEEKKDDGEPGAATKAVEGVKNLGGSAVEGAKNLGGSAVEGAKSLGEGVKNLGGGALKSLGIGK